MDTIAQIDEALSQMFAVMRAQYGKAVKGYWFYEGGSCPGCGSEVDVVKIQGEAALSLNVFIHRKAGILIGYFLCGRCAKFIFRTSKRNPTDNTPLHFKIEQNLIQAYEEHLAALDA